MGDSGRLQNVPSKKHPDPPAVEMDSAIGKVGGKVLLTLQLDCSMMLACLRDTNSYDDIPAISRFASLFGKKCLDALNLTIIPPDDVILDPKLLKGKI